MSKFRVTFTEGRAVTVEGTTFGGAIDGAIWWRQMVGNEPCKELTVKSVEVLEEGEEKEGWNIISRAPLIDVAHAAEWPQDHHAEQHKHHVEAIAAINKRLDDAMEEALKCYCEGKPREVPIDAVNIALAIEALGKRLDAIEANAAKRDYTATSAQGEPDLQKGGQYYVNIDGGISRHTWIPGRGDNLTAKEVCNLLNAENQALTR